MAVVDYITGLDHVGVPTMDMEATIAFYEAIGFKTIYETLNNGSRVLFMECQGVTIEIGRAHV